MSDPSLTAVICFANEGDEVENTVRSLREHSGNDIHILLIDDASTDGHDYESVADRYGCRYFLNSDQIGPAHCRHKGLRWAKTENVILLDAHMRFYEKDWHKRVNDAIAADPNALYCTASKALKAGAEPSGAPNGFGAYVQLLEDTFENSLQAKWNIRELGTTGTSHVPCILGGNYAMRREYLLSIGGYRGLHRYGGEEPLISIKSWLSGGSCKVINDVEIGHIYRGSEGAPWSDHGKYYHFNKLVTARVLMDDAGFEPYVRLSKNLPYAPLVQDVWESRKLMAFQARKEFALVQKRPLEYFTALNDAFRRGEEIVP